jgi:uncharacterized membrane protein YhaH (DUF805 family)
VQWYLRVLSRYAVFSGRARRREFWSFALVNTLVIYALGLVESVMNPNSVGTLAALYVLATALPALAVAIRRLHDTGLGGWYVLVGFIPFGNLFLLYLLVRDSDPHSNMYGPNPKAVVPPPPPPGAYTATSP